MASTKREKASTAAACLVVLLIAAGLKYHYSRAGSDDLFWILEPTTRLVEWMSDISFQKEAGSGFVNQYHRLIIAPSCAGINFMIIAFCMTAFCGISRMDDGHARQVWVVFSGLFAYGYAIVVNAVRIVLSVVLYEADIYWGWLTPTRVHRLEGILVYFLFLSLACFVVQHQLGALSGGKNGLPQKDRRRTVDTRGLLVSGGIPVLWYLIVAIGVPLMGGFEPGDRARFFEHTLTVISVCVVVFLCLFLIRLGCCLVIYRYFSKKKKLPTNALRLRESP